MFLEVSTHFYLGNCTNLFDENGDCVIHLFRDVSDFAWYAGLAECKDYSEEEREGNKEITKEEFTFFAGTPDFLELIEDCRYFHYCNGVVVAYDVEKDIHYFFC